MRFQAASLLQASGFRGNVTISRLNAHQGSATAENKRLRAELDRLDRIVNPPPPEPPEEPPPKPRVYVLALGELEMRIVPNAVQIPEAIKSIAPDAEWVSGMTP